MAVIRICFVCLGNICRSPTAEAVMRTLVERAGLAHLIEVESAGTGAYHIGSTPDERSCAAGKRRGFSLVSRARQFQARDFDRLDHVIAMDQQNLSDVLALAKSPEQRAKVKLFHVDKDGVAEPTMVPDPYFGGAAGFEQVLDICEAACTQLLESVRRTLPGAGTR